MRTPEDQSLSRRERQIMDVLFEHRHATVAEIREAIPKPPSVNAVRTMIGILYNKGLLARSKSGREYVYRPRRMPRTAGRAALRRVLATFFGGSLECAITAHFSDATNAIDDAELERLADLIETARRKRARSDHEGHEP